MSPTRRIVTLCAALCVVACDEEPSTALSLDGLEPPLDLDVSVPHLSRDLFDAREARQFGLPEGPARVLGEDEAEYVGQEDAEYFPQPGEEDLAPGIWSPHTSAVFLPGVFQAWGSHDYLANKARVDVTATVRHERTVLGSRTGVTEETYPFVPWWHHIVGSVSIATDTECGLSGDAYSDHAAWWEVAPGSGPSVFGAARASSSSGIVYQSACEPEIIPTTNTGGGGGEDVSDYYCWLYITYDLQTLEVLDIHVLWCGAGG